MAGIGETLRAARERRGMTIAEVSRSTRIARPFLDAIESEDFDALPAPVYARGFIRSYANLVGVDPAPLIEQLSAAAEAPPADASGREVPDWPQQEVRPGGESPFEHRGSRIVPLPAVRHEQEMVRGPIEQRRAAAAQRPWADRGRFERDDEDGGGGGTRLLAIVGGAALLAFASVMVVLALNGGDDNGTPGRTDTPLPTLSGGGTGETATPGGDSSATPATGTPGDGTATPPPDGTAEPGTTTPTVEGETPEPTEPGATATEAPTSDDGATPTTGPTSTATPTAGPTNTETPAPTPTVTSTPTPSPTPTATIAPTPIPPSAFALCGSGQSGPDCGPSPIRVVCTGSGEAFADPDGAFPDGSLPSGWYTVSVDRRGDIVPPNNPC